LVVAVGGHGTILRSTDAAVSWTRATSPSTDNLTSVYGARTGRIIAGGESGSLIASDDRGVTWHVLQSPAPEISAVWMDEGSHVVILGGQSSILRSADGGATWTSFTDSACGAFVDVRADGTQLWASAASCVATSSDSGATWKRVLSRKDVVFRGVWRDDGALAALASGSPSHAYSSAVIHSTNGGVTWTGFDAPNPFDNTPHAVWADAVGAILVGDHGSMFRTIDHGKQWEALGRYASQSLEGAWATGGTLVVVGDDGIIRRSLDGATTWQLANAFTAIDLSRVWLRDDGVALAGGSGTSESVILRSNDSGVTWKVIDASALSGSESIWAKSVVEGREMATDAKGNVYLLGRDSFSSSSDGATFSGGGWINGAPLGFDTLWCAPDGTLFIAGSLPLARGNVARSTDRGKTWTVSKDPSLGDPVGIAGTAHAVVVASRAGVFVSTDAGETFSAVLPKDDWRAVASGGGVVWVLGRGKIARSNDDGATWSVSDLAGAAGQHLGVDAHGNVLVVGTAGSILRYGPSPPETVALQAKATIETAATKEPSASPFQPAVDAANAQRAADKKWLAVATTSMQTWLEPLLSTVKRRAHTMEAFALTLGSPIATIESQFTVRRPCVPGRPPGTVCPRDFAAELTPQGAHDAAIQLRGRFVDGKLSSIDATLVPTALVSPEEQRVILPAFEAAMSHILGPASTVTRNPGTSSLTYGDSLMIAYTRYSGVSVFVGKGN
jgi:photosystem II stability/assembly factor-like uncharacterized protein